jgi:hypothetical protein
MPTFKLATSYSAGPPVAGRYDVRALIVAGDVDGNLYRNPLYAYQFTISADKNNLGSIYVGNQSVTPTNFSVELEPGMSTSESAGLQSASVDDYLCMSAQQAASTAPIVTNGAGGTNLLTAGVYRWKITFVTADGETEAGTASSPLTVDPATELPPALSAIPTGGTSVTARKVYRTVAGGSVYKLSGTIANNSGTTYTDNVADASLTTTAPTTNTAIPMRVNIFWESPYPLELP